MCPRDFFLFSDLKGILAGKKFSADEEVVAKTEAYLKVKDKWYYENGLEQFYDLYNQIDRKGNYMKYKIKLKKNVFVLYKLFSLNVRWSNSKSVIIRSIRKLQFPTF